MLKMKKFLSVALVVVMALSVMAMGTSALEAGKTFGFVLESDKTVAEIVPGAQVTVTIRYEMADFNQLMSDMRLAILFDDTVYTPDLSTRTYLNDVAGYAKDATQPTINPAFATTTMSKSTWSAEEQAKYNSCVMQVQSADAALGVTAKMGFAVTEEADGVSVPEFSIVFNVTGDEAAIAAGNINIAICDTCVSAAQYIKQTTGSATATVLPAIDASRGNILANMPEPPAGPAVDKAAAQVKFTSEGAGVADNFKLRIKSVITDADWDAYFANTADSKATTNAIKSVGIVAYKGTAGFDADTAKGVVNGTAAANYDAAETDYINKADDNADAYFGAIVDLNHSTCDFDITYMGFVKYVDADGNAQIIFYPTEYVAGVSTSYNKAVNSFLNA